MQTGSLDGCEQSVLGWVSNWPPTSVRIAHCCGPAGQRTLRQGTDGKMLSPLLQGAGWSVMVRLMEIPATPKLFGGVGESIYKTSFAESELAQLLYLRPTQEKLVYQLSLAELFWVSVSDLAKG